MGWPGRRTFPSLTTPSYLYDPGASLAYRELSEKLRLEKSAKLRARFALEQSDGPVLRP